MKFKRLAWLDALRENSRTYDTGCSLSRQNTGKFDLEHIPSGVRTMGRLIVKAFRSAADTGIVPAIAFNWQCVTIWAADGQAWAKIDNVLCSIEVRDQKRRDGALRNYRRTTKLQRR